MKKSFLFLLLIVLVSFRSWAQCTPASGFANCVTVTKTTDDGSVGTLRWAINQANANTGGTHIKFNINEPGIISIKLSSYLPMITKKIFLDGTSNPTYNNQTKDQVISIESLDISNKISNAINLYSTDISGSKINSILFRHFLAGAISISGETNSNITGIEIINNAFVDIGSSSGSYANVIIYISGYNNIFVASNLKIYQNIFNGYRINGIATEYYAENLDIQPIHMSCVSDVEIGNSNIFNANTAFRVRWFVDLNDGPNDTNLGINIKFGINYFSTYDLYYYNRPTVIADILNHNQNKQAPVSSINPSNFTITGTSSSNDVIRFYLFEKVNNSYYKTNVYLGSTVADASGNFTFLKSQWSNPSISTTNEIIAMNATTSNGISSDFSYLGLPTCPIVSFTPLPSIICKSVSIINLTGSPVGGTFLINGNATNILDPSILNIGSNSVSYSVTVNSVACQVTKNIQVPIESSLLKNVLFISAGTYNDAWPRDAQVPSSVPYGADGTKFMWAPEEQYAYVDDRDQTNTLTSRTDGLLQNVPWFNWNTTSNGTCYPAWRKLSSNTQIHYGVGMVEAQDILGNYSAVLSGYNNQLNIAAGANAEFHELGFESFEEYIPSQTLNLSNQSNGNITILNTYNSTTDRNKQYGFDYDVIEASGNMLTVNFPQNLLSTLPNKVVTVFGSGVLTNTNKEIHGNYTIESAVAIAGSSDVKIVLKAAEFNYSGVWSGKISIPLDLSKDFVPVVTAGVGTQVVNSSVWGTSLTRKAHSGTNFLQVNTNTEIEQFRLQLKPSQQYVVSAWISTNDPNASSYYDANRAVAIDFIDINGAKIAGSGVVFTVSTTPGNIIEGWQKIEGTFTMPANAVRFTVKLLTPLNTVTYFDDIRIHPADGNMVSYVYNITDYKLSATLDQNNYATYYYYDESGSLYLVKKETERGIMTIQESYGHTTEINK